MWLFDIRNYQLEVTERAALQQWGIKHCGWPDPGKPASPTAPADVAETVMR
jgi:hypothetical protein